MSFDAIVLAAHGAGDDSPANALVRSFAARLQTERPAGKGVHVAFNLGTPHFSEVLAMVAGRRVLIVPIMTSDGYFMARVLPQQLLQAQGAADKHIAATTPLGVRPEAAELLRSRIAEAVRQFDLPPRETAAVLVGHGTQRSRQSGAATRAFAEQLAAGDLLQVLPAFIDEAVHIGDVEQQLTPEANHVVLAPHLIGGGTHARRDIVAALKLPLDDETPLPALVSTRGRRWVLTPPLGDGEELFTLVNAALDEARAGAVRVLHTPPSSNGSNL